LDLGGSGDAMKIGMMKAVSLRLAHGWQLARDASTSKSLLREFIRPAVRAVPSTLARRLGACRIWLPEEVETGVASRWALTGDGLEIRVARAEVEDHDIAMELLVCVGQALWEKLSEAECRAYYALLAEETGGGVEGEIDEQALEAKRSLVASRSHGAGLRRLAEYGRDSFAGTAAEYVHSLWHDVGIRTGPDYLPAPWLRRRLELLARWFPPDRGYRLFARRTTASA
jgi:hypothetical protein